MRMFFWVMMIPTAWAQIYPFERLTIDDGLPHFTIYTTWQDEQGNLWVGTRGGLVRYDGQEMATPLQDDPYAPLIAHALSPGPNKQVVFGTHNGSFLYDSKGQIKRILKADTHDIINAPNGTLWFATSKGVYRMKEQGVPEPIPLPESAWHSLAGDQQGNMWFGGSKGLWHAHEGKFSQIEAFGTAVVRSLLFDGKSLWCLAGQKLIRFRNGSKETVTLTLDNPTNLMLDQHQNLWISSANGAWFGKVRPDTTLMTFKQLGPDLGLGHPKVHHIYEDREGNLWFSTEIGLYRLRWLAFQNFGLTQGLLDNTVWAITSDRRDRIWIGSYRGISILNKDMTFDYLTAEEGLPDGQVRALEPDRKGGFYIATTGGLAQTDGQKVTRIDGKGAPCHKFLRGLAHDSEGQLWVGTDGGGVCYGKPGSFKHLRKADGLSGNRVFRLKKDGSGMWIGTQNGLSHWNGDHIDQNFSMKDGLPSNMVFAIEPWPDGTLWVGTVAGLARKVGDRFDLFLQGQGLSDDTCYFIYTDPNKHLWIGTNKGLNIFDGNHFSVINSQHGLPFDELNLGAFHKDRHENLWFGTYDGAASMNPQYIHPQGGKLEVCLEKFQVGDQDIPFTNPPSLAHHQNSVTFHYKAAHLTSPDTVKYRYRLEGFETRWQEGKERRTRYTALEPGDYCFVVTSRAENKAWSNEARLPFTIRQPFWHTWTFYLFMTLSLAVFLYWNMRDLRRRNRQLRYKTKALGQEVARERAGKLGREAELQLLHSQMNPHFLQNALNTAIYFSQTSPEHTTAILNRLSKLLRQAYNTTLTGESTLASELEMVENYLEIQALRFGDRLKYQVLLKGEDSACMIPCFLVQPLVENAVIHGFKEVMNNLNVVCTCERINNNLTLTVQNNGRPPNDDLKSWLSKGGALKNIDTRLRLLYNQGVSYKYEEGFHQFEIRLILEENT